MGTPVGVSVNLMAMQLLESTAGIKITFTQWACLGIPVVLILTPIAFLIVWYIYKPELKTLKGTENVDERLNALGALGKQEKKYIVFITITLLLWMTESFHGINMAIVSAVAAIVLFLPGINILTWENTKNFIQWEIVVIMCYCMALGTIIWNTGAANWFASLLSGLVEGRSLIVMLIILGLVVAYMHLICPANHAIVSIFVPVACAIAVSQGLNPASLAIPVGFVSSTAILLPLDAVSLVCYASGHFKMTDMFKAGFFIIIAWVGVVTFIMMTLARMMGLV